MSSAPFFVRHFVRALPAIFALLAPPLLRAAPPLALANALERLRDQKSYSWEVINADPGPVAQQYQTRRGAVNTVMQNTAPHISGRIDRNGDMLIVREWSDGLKLETFIAADGAMITLTPEGWMTDKEVLNAIAEEQMLRQGATPRLRWLRQADRPNIRRPDQELVPFLKGSTPIEAVGDTFTARARLRADGSVVSEPDESEASVAITIAMNVSGGVIRDYEVKLEASRPRLRVPLTDQRIVIITYLPVTRIGIPDEARAKLRAARGTTGARAPTADATRE
jgi:hypothetical protein